MTTYFKKDCQNSFIHQTMGYLRHFVLRRPCNKLKCNCVGLSYVASACSIILYTSSSIILHIILIVRLINGLSKICWTKCPMESTMKLIRALTILSILLISLMPFQVVSQTVVVDSLGRTLTISPSLSKIIVLSPSITEFMAYLNELNRIIAADSQSLSSVWYLNASNILTSYKVQDVGGYWWSAIKIEEILRLKPDLVLADKGAHIPLLKVFEDYNITVVYLNGGSSSSVNEILSDLHLLATIFGKEEVISKFVNDLHSAFVNSQRLVTMDERHKILVVVGIYNGIWVAGRGTFIDDILSRLGFENAANTYSWSAVNIERIMEWDPDLILVTPIGIDEKMIKDSGLTMFNDKLIILNETEADILLRPGPLVVYVPEVLGKHIQTIVKQESSARMNEEVIHYSNRSYLLMSSALIATSLIIGVLIGKYAWRSK